MDRTYAFVDESGNSDLETSKGGSSGFFIVCSILVAEKDLEAAYAQAEALRNAPKRELYGHRNVGVSRSFRTPRLDAHERCLTIIVFLPRNLVTPPEILLLP
jgi:hypothetical protein